MFTLSIAMLRPYRKLQKRHGAPGREGTDRDPRSTYKPPYLGAEATLPFCF